MNSNLLSIIKSLMLATILILPGISNAQSGTPQGGYEGYDFWVAFMPNNNNNPNNTLNLYITSRYATTATVSTPLIPTPYTTTVSIAANGVTTVTVPSTIGAYATDQPLMNTPYPTGIHIVSPYPISVFGSNVYTASSETWLNIPTAALNTDYLSVAFTGYASGALPSQFLVMATATGTTTVNFNVPAGKLVSGHTSSFTVNLIQGQVYLVQSADPTTESDPYELTGVHVTSNKPIAMYGGADCTGYPQTGNRGGYASCGPCDHLVEMIAPTTTWGGNYIVPYFSFTKAPESAASGGVKTKGSYIRVVSDEPGPAVVSITGQAAMTLNGLGDYNDRLITANTVVSSTKRISVYEIMAATACYSAIVTSGYGDPCFTNITPVEQWGTRYSFTTPSGAVSFNHYINIIKRSNVGKVSLDGTNQTGFTNIAGTNYYALNGVSVAAGVHNLVGDSICVVGMYGDELADGYCNQVSGSNLQPVIMPVIYASFSGSLTDKKHVKLTWITGEEKNSKEYIVERMNSSSDYTAVGTVAAAGYSSVLKTYTYEDNLAGEGVNYYRLKQIDNNGHVYYSNMINVSVPVLKTRILSSTWVNGDLSLSFNATDAGVFTFSIYDIQGRSMLRQDVPADAEGNSSVTLNTSHLNAGMYLVQISGSDGSTLQQLKVVK